MNGLAFLMIASTAFQATPLTLRDLFETARRQNELLPIAAEGLAQASARERQALAPGLPQVTAGIQLTRYSKGASISFPPFVDITTRPAEDWNSELKVSQLLFGGGQVYYGRKAAQVGHTLAEAQHRKIEGDLLFQVTAAYYQWLEATQDLNVTLLGKSLAASQAKVAESRLKAGEAVELDKLQAELAIQAAEREDILARSTLQLSHKRLLELTGAPLEADIEVKTPVVPALPDENAILERAFREHPDLRSARLQQAIAVHQQRMRRGGLLPTAQLEAFYRGHKATFPAREDLAAQLTLGWKLFDGGDSLAKMSEARSQERQADLQGRLKERQLRLELAEAYKTFHDMEETLRVLVEQKSVANRSLLMLHKAYRVGERTSLELDSARERLIRLEREWNALTLMKDLTVWRIYYVAGLFTTDHP